MEFPKNVRKGESCSILVRVPATGTVKEVTIDISEGATLPDGNVFKLAPDVRSLDIPVTFSHDAPDDVRVRIKVRTKSEEIELSRPWRIRR